MPGWKTQKVLRLLTLPCFFAIMMGFACQKAWLSAQSEALRVVRDGDDGSKTDSCGAWRFQEYKLGILK
jgi:hypothetical protein